MKTKIFLISFLTAAIGSSVVSGGEYNFYFYDNSDEKPKTAKKEEIPAEESTKGVTQEEISKLADEMAAKLAAKMKSENPQTQAVVPPAVVAVVPQSQSTVKEHSLIPAKYLSVGAAYDHFDYKFGRDAYSVGVLARAKFLPLITLEGSFPLEERVKRHHNFRAGGLLELNLTRTFGLNIGGGAVVGRKVFEPPVIIRKAFTPYVGAGARIRIADHLDLMASYNVLYERFREQIKYGTEGIKSQPSTKTSSYFEQILTAGVSYVF